MIHYKNQAKGRWFEISFTEQMANIGMEILRAIKHRREDDKYFNIGIEKAIELIDLTKNDPKNRKRLKEICRLKEVIIDYFWGENEFESDEKFFENYFNFFINYASKLREERRKTCQK